MSRPKGHMGEAGIVPVFLDADHIWILHRYAQHEHYLSQEAAEILLAEALDQWNDEHPE